jgi:hypothetical protein
LDGHHSRHLQPAPSVSKSRIPSKNFLISSETHSHKPSAPILVFLSLIDRL